MTGPIMTPHRAGAAFARMTARWLCALALLMFPACERKSSHKDLRTITGTVQTNAGDATTADPTPTPTATAEPEPTLDALPTSLLQWDGKTLQGTPDLQLVPLN